MGCQDYLTHYVAGINRVVDIHGQIPNKSCHGSQSLGMNAILRFFDTYQPLGFRIFGQHRESEESQGAIRYCIRSKSLASRFGDRQREQFTNVVTNNIDACHGDKLGKSRGYSRDNAAVRTFHLLQPIQRRGKMRSVVGNDSRISSEAIGATHGARFERE